MVRREVEAVAIAVLSVSLPSLSDIALRSPADAVGAAELTLRAVAEEVWVRGGSVECSARGRYTAAWVVPRASRRAACEAAVDAGLAIARRWRAAAATGHQAHAQLNLVVAEDAAAHARHVFTTAARGGRQLACQVVTGRVWDDIDWLLPLNAHLGAAVLLPEAVHAQVCQRYVTVPVDIVTQREGQGHSAQRMYVFDAIAIRKQASTGLPVSAQRVSDAFRALCAGDFERVVATLLPHVTGAGIGSMQPGQRGEEYRQQADDAGGQLANFHAVRLLDMCTRHTRSKQGLRLPVPYSRRILPAFEIWESQQWQPADLSAHVGLLVSIGAALGPSALAQIGRAHV